MSIPFDERFEQVWVDSSWIVEEMMDHGMCFFEGYVPAINLDLLGVVLPQLSKDVPDFHHSIWSDASDESDWNRSCSVSQCITFFQSGHIQELHADYTVVHAGFDFKVKLIFDSDANLEVIFYRENLLPRRQTKSRFSAACDYLRHLQTSFLGDALFIGPDTLNYPNWPDNIPEEWQRLV